jgi:hypothetical protein
MRIRHAPDGRAVHRQPGDMAPVPRLFFSSSGAGLAGLPRMPCVPRSDWDELTKLQEDALGAYTYAVALGTRIHAGQVQLRALRSLREDHRMHLGWLERARPLVGRAREGAALMRARGRVRFAARRGWPAVLRALAESERQLCVRMAQFLPGGVEGMSAAHLGAMIRTSTRAADWLAIDGLAEAQTHRDGRDPAV